MANFDVLSGRLLLDTTDFVRSLQQASTAAQIFTQRLSVSLQSARRDLEQLSASQARFAASAQAWSRRGAAAPWSALFAGPAAAFNSPTGNTSQAALTGFVERVNQSLSRQAGLADQLTEAVDRVRIAVEERARPGREIHDQFKEAADTVVELLKKAGESIEASLDKLVDKAHEAAEQVGELNDKLGELADKSKEADDKVAGLNDKLKDFAEKCESAADKLEELGKKLEDAFAGKFAANGGANGFAPNGGAGAGGWPGGFPAGTGLFPLAVGPGPALMAGGFAPKGQRGQEPPPTIFQTLFDRLTDAAIGATRAHGAAGPEPNDPRAKEIRRRVAERRTQQEATSGRDTDDWIKMLSQARTLTDFAALLGKVKNAAADTFNRIRDIKKRIDADDATTKALAGKKLPSMRADRKKSEQQYNADLQAILNNFATNPTTDKEEIAARKNALRQLRRAKREDGQLRRRAERTKGAEGEVAAQQLIEHHNFMSDIIYELKQTKVNFKRVEDAAEAMGKQFKNVTRAAAEVEKADENEADRKQAEKRAAEQRGAQNEKQQATNVTPQQFAIAQQQMLMQQFMQQAANAVQQQFATIWQTIIQQMSNSLTDIFNAILGRLTGLGIGEAIQGTQDLQDLIDKKRASGDSVGAVDLEIQNVKMRLQQSMFNLHQLSIDPAAGGGFGGFPGSDNSAYFLTLDTPLTREIKSLQAQLDQLEKQRHDLATHSAPKKMASGGIVSGATAAVVGEAGPEAVLPLSSFANMLGALPVFSNINSAMESISDSLVAQGRTGEASRWDQVLDRVQSSFEYVSNFVENARRIDLRPQGMLRPLTQGLLMDQEMAARNQAYRIGGLSTGDLALHFHGVDISDTGAARQFAQQLLPALELEARSLGQDMTGRSVFRSPNMTGPGTPGRPYGFAR